MKKSKVTSLILGSALASGTLAVSLYASDMKCGANKCGNSDKSQEMKCGANQKMEDSNDSKSVDNMKATEMKCGSGKCGSSTK